MAITTIPERVSQCRAYSENARLNCTGELTLPEFNRISADVSGAGIAGVLNTPTRGNFESSTASFASRVVTDEFIKTFSPGLKTLEFRAVIQGINNLGESVEHNFSAFMRVMCKGVTLGTINNAAEMGATANFEVVDITITIDGTVLVNISKMNNIVEIVDSNGRLVDENQNANSFLGV